MQKVILIGFGPDPNKSSSRSAFSLRTSMLEHGLDINDIQVEKLLVYDGKHDGCFNINSQKDRQSIKNHINKSDAQFVLASGFSICKLITGFGIKNKYIISDLNGWTLSEVQAKSFDIDSNVLLDKTIHTEKQILKHSDFLITVSSAQKFATYGELAILGLLNKSNFGRTVVSHIANKGIAFQDIKNQSDPNKFTIIWLGGFNNWADEKTLFQGVSRVMQKYSFVEMIVTGGAIYGVNDSKYKWFCNQVEQSEYKHRFTLLNWAAAKDIPNLITSSDLGVNCDIKCLETLTGARNRVNELIVNGVPVISSDGSEVSKQIKTLKLGTTFESGNSYDLAEKIEIALLNQQKIWSQNCQNYRPDYLDFRELITFIKQPFDSTKSSNGFFKRIAYYLKTKSLRDVIRKLGG